MTDTPVGIRTLGQRQSLQRDNTGRVLHGLLAAAWIGLPFTLGVEAGDALSARSAAVADVASVGLWLVWTVVMVALALPRTDTLVVVRMAVPGAIAAAVWTTYALDDISALTTTAIVHSLVVTALAGAPAVGERFVQGSAYGDERRFPLRVPPALLLGPIEAMWLGTFAALAGPPLLAAAGQWAAAIVALVVGVPVALAGWRAASGLARRWIVLVPAGLVVHDPYVLSDPVLFDRRLIARWSPAPADTDAVDLTAGAMGLVLELELNDSVPVQRANTGWRRRTPGDAGRIRRLLVSPVRPGRALAEAHRRRIPTS